MKRNTLKIRILTVVNALKLAILGSPLILLAACGQMSQQKSGHAGAAVGAALGGLGMGALAKNQGARGSDLVAPVAIGAFGGAAIGNTVGQRAGTPGVYKTEVPTR